MCNLLNIFKCLLYTTIQKFGVGKFFLCFWKKSLLLTKAAFIWLKKYSKSS